MILTIVARVTYVDTNTIPPTAGGGSTMEWWGYRNYIVAASRKVVCQLDSLTDCSHLVICQDLWEPSVKSEDDTWTSDEVKHEATWVELTPIREAHQTRLDSLHDGPVAGLGTSARAEL